MADTATYLERGLSMLRGTNTALRLKANAAIGPNLLLSMDTSGNVGPAAAGSAYVVGASADITTAAIHDPVEVLSGHVILTADAGAIVAGYPIKAGNAGKATVFIDGTLAGGGLYTSGAGVAFANQPANDGIEVLSAAAGDTTQTVTVYGTTNGADTLVAETIALNGVAVVPSVKVDWGVILGVVLSGVTAGNITVQEASANADIVVIAAGDLTAGMEAVTGGSVGAFNVKPIVTADGATTKQIGLVGTSYVGTAALDSQALNGATAVTMNTAFQTIEYVLTGDLEAARTVTVGLGAEEDEGLKIGRAMENQAVAGDTFLAYVTP